MPVSRALIIFILTTLPSLAATFGTVVTHQAPLADLVLDEARKRLYVVNSGANSIEVYSVASNPPRLTNTVKTHTTPLAAAISRNGKSLYVACYSDSTLDVIDLTSASFPSHPVSLSASPQGVAVGVNELVLISTIGTGVGQSVLVTYDPTTNSAQSVAVAPPAPAAPTLPPPGGIWALSNHSQLKATPDGRTIIGVHEQGATRTVFVFDVLSAKVLSSRVVAAISPVLAISPDGSTFFSGPLLFETKSLLILAQQNVTNSPYVFPAGANFNVQTNQGGAVFAQSAFGPALISAYNIVPVQNPAAKSNTSQLLFNTPDNLSIQLGLQLPETLSGKMVITADSSTIYAISQSGFVVLPLGSLLQFPIAIPDSNVALLAFDQCGVTSAQNSSIIPIRNVGGGRLTVTTQVLTNTTTSTTVRATAKTYGADVTATFSAVAARTIGTATPDQLLVQAAEAVNIIPNVRVYQNNRNAESRGNILPLDIGATTTGLTDMTSDTVRQRLYLANPGLNRIEVFDMQRQQFLNPVRVGQLPRSMAIGNDGNTLYVANSGGETISVVDLNQLAVTGRIDLPPLPFNASFGILTPQIVANSQRGPQVLMSDGTLWRIVGNTLSPRTLNTNVFGNVRSVPGPQSMVATPDGSYILLLAGNGSAYLYDASLDDFVSGRQVIPTPIVGYYGPIAAGPGGQYYLTNDQILNAALTSVGSSSSTGPVGGGGLPTPGGPTGRPVAAVAAVGSQSFARFSMPLRASAATAPTDAGLIEIVDVATLRTTATSNALEGPLTAAVGTARAIVNGRSMAIDSSGTRAYVVTASGLSIIPLSSTTQTAPQLNSNAVVNTANFTASVAPGGLVTISGRNLASSATGSAPLPTILGGSCVTLNNSPLPLLFSSATQINAQLPPTLAAGRYPLVVRSIAGQAASGSANVTVAKYAPAVFFDAQGPAIFHKDGTRVNKDHPASRDEPLTIFATGLGVTTGGKVTAGSPAPTNPLAVTAPVNLYFGNPKIKEAAIIVNWSGLQPGSIGVYQINCKIPGAHIKGDALPVTVRIGGVDSPTTGPTAAVIYVN